LVVALPPHIIVYAGDADFAHTCRAIHGAAVAAAAQEMW